MKHPIEVEMNCIGYFGFGSGVHMSRRMSSEGPSASPQEMYCNTCPRKDECWNKHRQRVRRITPELAALCDDLVKEGFRGLEYIREYQKRIDVVDAMPPELLVMSGNIQDGAYVNVSGKPLDRGESTLHFPFES